MILKDAPEGFQPTEIGLIPVDWKLKQAKDISGCIVPGRNKPKKFDGIIPWVTTSDIDELGKIDNSKISLFISKEEANAIGSRVVPANAVIMSCVGELGVVCVAENEIVINQQLHAFLPNSKINSKYLSYILSSLREYFYSKATKTTLPYLNKDNCNSTPIPLTCIEEQTAIANALSDVDTLLMELEKLIAKKQAIKTATMQQLLTGKTRLPQFATYTEGEKQGVPEGKCKGTKPSELGETPEDWDVRNLGDLLEENRIPSGLYKDKNLYGTGTAIIKLGDVFKNDSFNPDIVQRVKTTNIENKAYRVKIGDLIIALASVKLEGVGKVMIIKELSEPTVYDHNVALIRFKNNCNSNFMSFLFKSNYIRSLVASRATQVGTTFLKTSTILEFPILLPSPEEQTAIATILSDMDNEIQTLELRLAKTRQIKQGMMQQLLTGRTRLPFKQAKEA